MDKNYFDLGLMCNFCYNTSSFTFFDFYIDKKALDNSYQNIYYTWDKRLIYHMIFNKFQEKVVCYLLYLHLAFNHRNFFKYKD